MREVKDAALLERRASEGAKAIQDAISDPLKRPAPRYYRGALIKPK